jgi:hypothetical protein
MSIYKFTQIFMSHVIAPSVDQRSYCHKIELLKPLSTNQRQATGIDQLPRNTVPTAEDLLHDTARRMVLTECGQAY